MQIVSEEFGLQLNNIPTINLRNEFLVNFDLLTRREFRSQFSGPVGPISTPYLQWRGMPNTFLTLLMQRAIIGIEAYTIAAVYYELGVIGRLKENIEFIRNPYLLKGRGTAENLYNRLPAMASSEYMLRAWNPQLWLTTRTFYSNIRNPLFHGYEVEASSVNGVLKAYRHIGQLYEWIDAWHNPEKVIPGFGKVVAIQAEIAKRDL